MPRYKCIVEYDGTEFYGWQRQIDYPTVQQHIEESIEKFAGHKVVIHVSGRTDAGVHALAQVFHFDMEKEMTIDEIMGALNFHVRPAKIAILQVEVMDKEFHARFSSKRRYYRYNMINRRAPLALDNKRAWFVPNQLDINKMQQAAKHLIGYHDFSSFRDSKCQAKSPLRTLDEIKIETNEDSIIFHLDAKSFLHHMVRNIVGTLKFVGEGKFSPNDMIEILDAKNRSSAGPTAPAHGLYFVKVDY